MAIGLAFKAFFQVLWRKEAASAVQAALSGIDSHAPTAPPTQHKPVVAPTRPAEPVVPKTETRNDALTLLSTLQREARFLDLVGESLASFEDAQVGAAARQVISDVRKSLDRMFALGPLEKQEEGSPIIIPRPASPVRYHILGRGAEQATRGTLVHRGWKAERCQTPSWNGARDDAFVLSPVEIEVDGQ